MDQELARDPLPVWWRLLNYEIQFDHYYEFLKNDHNKKYSSTLQNYKTQAGGQYKWLILYLGDV